MVLVNITVLCFYSDRESISSKKISEVILTNELVNQKGLQTSITTELNHTDQRLNKDTFIFYALLDFLKNLISLASNCCIRRCQIIS